MKLTLEIFKEGLQDNDSMPIGKYKNQTMASVPEDWYEAYWYKHETWYQSIKENENIEKFYHRTRYPMWYRFMVMEYIEFRDKWEMISIF